MCLLTDCVIKTCCRSATAAVMALNEQQVQGVIDDLVKKHLVSERSGFGGRVPKYQHRFCNTGFGGFEFSPQELGVLCMLLLRGPQTPGELRTRTQRLCHFDDVNETEQVLKDLMERQDGPFVARLPREAGKRESRYQHLFGDDSELPLSDVYEEVSPATDELAQLVQQMHEMRAELDELKQRVALLEGE
ncbi:MAG: DUF480 domain-containing protein [Candidatus Thiodiazotropha sp.]